MPLRRKLFVIAVVYVIEGFPMGVFTGVWPAFFADLGVPLVGVGLFYRFGYMKQRLSSDGQQVAVDVENLPRQLAVDAVRDVDGKPVEITVPLPGREFLVNTQGWLSLGVVVWPPTLIASSTYFWIQKRFWPSRSLFLPGAVS